MDLQSMLCARAQQGQTFADDKNFNLNDLFSNDTLKGSDLILLNCK